jgi:hypothetical protein
MMRSTATNPQRLTGRRFTADNALPATDGQPPRPQILLRASTRSYNLTTRNCNKSQETARFLGVDVTEDDSDSAHLRELGAKLLYLLPGYDLDGLVGELHQYSHIAHRTIRGWLGLSPPKLRHLNRKMIVNYLSDRHQINFHFEWFSCSFEDIKKLHAKSFTASSSTGAAPRTGTPLIQPLPPDSISIQISGVNKLTKEHVELLCGKYELYRYSFSDRGDVVVEIAAIAPISGNEHELAISIHCHPAYENNVDKPKPRTKNDTEEFTGTLFRMGMMFSAICSYATPRDRRMRYLYFPVLQVNREEHYGLVSSYSPNLREPVAARIFARRISQDPELRAEDFARVQRGAPDDKAGPRIPRDIIELIANRIETEKSSILTVDQKKGARRSGE